MWRFPADTLTLRRSRDAYSSIVSAASCLPCRRYSAAKLRRVVVTVGLNTIIIYLFHECRSRCRFQSYQRITAHRQIILHHTHARTHTHTHAHLMALCPGLPGWAGTRKVNQSGFYWSKRQCVAVEISWAICKSAPRSTQITTPAPHRAVFYRPDALPATQPSKHWRQIILHRVWQKTYFITEQCKCALNAQNPTKWPCKLVTTVLTPLLHHTVQYWHTKYYYYICLMAAFPGQPG